VRLLTLDSRPRAFLSEKSLNDLVVVTGASSGIGFATAQLLIQRGLDVLLVGREIGRLEKTKLRLGADEQRVLVGQLRPDTTESDAQMIHELIVKSKRTLVGLVCSAGGIRKVGPLESLTSQDWQDTITDNLILPVAITKALLPTIKENAARVVFVSSFVWVSPGLWNPHYAVAKSGLINFVKYLAQETAKYGVTVNSVSPAYTATEGLLRHLGENDKGALSEEVQEPDLPSKRLPDMAKKMPIGRLLSPSEVATTILFLLEGPRSISGIDVLVDGAFTASRAARD